MRLNFGVRKCWWWRTAPLRELTMMLRDDIECEHLEGKPHSPLFMVQLHSDPRTIPRNSMYQVLDTSLLEIIVKTRGSFVNRQLVYVSPRSWESSIRILKDGDDTHHFVWHEIEILTRLGNPPRYFPQQLPVHTYVLKPILFSPPMMLKTSVLVHSSRDVLRSSVRP